MRSPKAEGTRVGPQRKLRPTTWRATPQRCFRKGWSRPSCAPLRSGWPTGRTPVTASRVSSRCRSRLLSSLLPSRGPVSGFVKTSNWSEGGSVGALLMVIADTKVFWCSFSFFSLLCGSALMRSHLREEVLRSAQVQLYAENVPHCCESQNFLQVRGRGISFSCAVKSFSCAVKRQLEEILQKSCSVVDGAQGSCRLDEGELIFLSKEISYTCPNVLIY